MPCYCLSISVSHLMTVLLSFLHFLFFFNFYWHIVALQCCVSFYCTAKWISYTYTYIPFFLDFLPIQVISGVSFIRALIPFMRVPLLKLNHLPESHLQLPSHWGLDFYIWICGGHMHSVMAVTQRKEVCITCVLHHSSSGYYPRTRYWKTKVWVIFCFCLLEDRDMSVLPISSSESNTFPANN